MRGTIEGLITPHPLGVLLPALLQGDDFTRRFVAGLDDVLAPVLLVLDTFDAYLDPALAPDDFLTWLAGWVGVQPDDAWSPDRRRALVGEMVALSAAQGTTAALRRLVELVTDRSVEVSDSGGATWSASPGSPLPGEAVPWVAVRVEGGVEDPEGLRRLVRDVVPAHVPVTLEGAP